MLVPRKALGSGGLKNVVEAVDAIGADGVAEIARWHQAYGSREAASMIRRGLAVAQKGGEELKASLVAVVRRRREYGIISAVD